MQAGADSGNGAESDVAASLPGSVSAAGYWEWDIAAKSVFFSDRLLEVLCLKGRGNRFAEGDVPEIVHPDDRGRYRQRLYEYLSGETEVFSVEVRVVDDRGALHWVVNRGVLQYDDEGNPVKMSGSITDITAQRKLEAAIRLAAGIATGPGSAGTFVSLAECLARSLQCDMAFVGRLEDDGEVVRTLGVWCDGAARDNFTYRLEGSPCQNVVGQEMCVIPDAVSSRFPNDRALVAERFEGYAGVPLFSAAAHPIGLIVALYRAPIEDPELCGNQLSIFAARAASEIERRNHERALVDSERRFRDFAEASADHFWETDEQHRFVRVSAWAQSLIGLKPAQVTGLARWDFPNARPLEDPDWSTHRAVLDAHREFRDFLYSSRSDEGEKFISVSGVPVFDERGEFRGYRGTATDVTNRMLARRSENEARERLALAVSAADLYVWDWEIGAPSTYWRTDPEPLLGPRPRDGYPDFRTMVLEPDRDAYRRAFRRSIEEGAPYAVEFRLRRTDGAIRWVAAKGSVVRGAGDAPPRMIGVTQDITARREHEERLRLGATVFNTREPIMITDLDGIILDVNQAFLAMFGYSRNQVLGYTPAILQSGHHDREFFRAFWQRLSEDGYWQGEMWNRAGDGTVIPNWMVIDSVVDETGRAFRYVATCNDISERKQAEERIQKLAWYDALTGLPNRRMLAATLDDVLGANRRGGSLGGILLVDVDDFKTINESLGYRHGDAMLAAVAKVIGSSATTSHMVARAGADEFAVLVRDLGDDRDRAARRLREQADAILEALGQPLSVRGESFRLSCSVGIHLFPEGELGAEELLSQCEIALNRAKLDGYNSRRFYHPEMKERSDERMRVQVLLSTMVDKARIENLYQPQVDDEARVIGVEALARLRDDDGVLIEPAHFIPVAEESGLIYRLGEQVLRRALEDLRQWRDAGVFSTQFVAVNVSPRQFLQEGFAESVVSTLAETGLAGDCLELEITESLLVEDFDRVVAVMTTLKTHGVRFAIDDFGTGYSSLSYLNRLPIDKLKIDKSFVAGLEQDETSRAIVTIILSMARAMNLRVVAEGVETSASREALKAWGCLAYQGYLFDRPTPAALLGSARPAAERPAAGH